MTSVPFSPLPLGTYTRGEPITTSDSVVQSWEAIYVGVAGNLAIIPAGQTDAITLVGVAAGTIIPIAVSKVMNTNTTASSLVGLTGVSA